MGFPGLKVKIFFTLVVLLATGMLLIVVVMTVFWQRDAVQRELLYVTGLLTLVDKQLPRSLSGNPAENVRISRGMESVLRQTGIECGVLVVRDEMRSINGLPSCSSDVLKKTAGRAQALGTMQSQVVGAGFLPFLQDNRQLLVAVPLERKGRAIGGIAVAIPFSSIHSGLREYQRIILVSLLVNLIVLSVVGLFRFIQSTIRPVEKLVSLTDSYSEEDGNPFLMLRAGDEFGQLSGALNRMLERIEADRQKLRSTVHSLEEANRELQNTQQEMIKAEKLASVGRLAAGLAHEIGNPLGIVQGYLGLLKVDSLATEERQDYVDRAEQELLRVNTLIRQLLDFARTSAGQQAKVFLHDVLASLVSMVRLQPFMDTVEIFYTFSAAEDGVLGDPEQLRQVFLNCLINSADAIAMTGNKRGKIEIETRLVSSDHAKSQAGDICVLISDNGIGIRQEDLPNVFDPFFSTKEPGKGTGLGLSVSHSIIEAHGGSMKIRSRHDNGTTVSIRLPLCGKLPNS